MRRRDPLSRAALVIGGLALVIVGLDVAHRVGGFWWVRTASVPVGVWRISDALPARGDVVMFCPPDIPIFQAARAAGIVHRGDCPGGYEPFFKPVAAWPGDTVEIGHDGVRVNGQPVANSRPLSPDQLRPGLQPYPPGRYTVQPGQIWLVSHYHPDSFDSRYFGPIPLTAVRGVARPFWLLHSAD